MHRWLRVLVLLWLEVACSAQASTGAGAEDADVQRPSARSSVDVLAPMTPAAAETHMVASVSVSKKTACAKLTGFRSTQLCVFVDLATMGHALQRAAFYIEQRPGSFLTDQAIAGESNIVGFDLESAALARFYDHWQKRLPVLADTSTADHRAALANETAFWQGFVTPDILPDRSAVLLAIASDGYQASTFDHELIHAAFFETPAMDTAVQTFLETEVDAADFAAIRKIFEPSYSLGDARLIRNEFAAYMLMSDAENANLGAFVGKYAERLRKHLRTAGLALMGHAGPLL